jgi:hypothetical protein
VVWVVMALRDGVIRIQYTVAGDPVAID